MLYPGSMQIDQTYRPAALSPIEEGLAAVAESYASGGVPSSEHMQLSSAIFHGRRAVLADYGNNLRLLVEHMDDANPNSIPGLAELVVRAAIPRVASEMGSASRDPDLLAARAEGLRGFLRGIVDIEPGEPYTLSYCDAETGAIEHAVFGQIQEGPLELYAPQGHSEDGLFLRTPLVRQDPGKFFRNGLIPVTAMAARTEDGILRLELAAGTHVITSALKGRVAEMRQSETTEEAFAAAVDVVKNASANNVSLETVASAEELATLGSLIGTQVVKAEFGTVDFDTAALAVTRLERLQHACLQKARQTIMHNLVHYDPNEHVQKLHEYCVDLARKLLVIDLLPQVKNEKDCVQSVQYAKQTFDGKTLGVYIKEAYALVGTAHTANS